MVIDTSRLTRNIKQMWDDNPVAVVTAGALAVTAAAKLIEAMSSARSRRAYARQVDYRVKHRK